MTIRERVEWFGRMAFLFFILASAAFLSAITAMRIAIHGREVTMPNLVGRNVSEASQALRSNGLVLHVADRVYSDLPINQVVRQTPPPGMLMKMSQPAHVVLSLGQRQLEIPSLEGNSLRASRIELLRAGLQVGEISMLALPDQPSDTVVMQNPRSGKGAATPRVDVLVAEAPRDSAFVMPNFIGTPESEASRRLDQSNVKRKLHFVEAPEWPHGAVVNQSPAVGTRLGSASEVDLVVAN